MATGDKIVNLDDLKVVHDHDASVTAALSDRVDSMHDLVKYWGADYVSGTGNVKRYGTRLYLNAEYVRSTGINQSKGFRLNGAYAYFANRNQLDDLTDGIKLTDGHTYRWYYRTIEGTQTRDGVAGNAMNARIYAVGGHTSLGTTGYYGKTAYREFTYTDAAYPNGVQLVALIFTDAVLVFNNWAGSFILEDVTYGDNADPAIAATEAGDTARANHPVGELILWNGNLYTVTTAITTGDAIAGKVSAKTTVAAQIAALAARIAALENN